MVEGILMEPETFHIQDHIINILSKFDKFLWWQVIVNYDVMAWTITGFCPKWVVPNDSEEFVFSEKVMLPCN